MSHRIERFSSTLRHTLADILMNEVDNPHLRAVTITAVSVSPDLKKARIFVAAAGGDEDTEAVIRHLDKARGFIKRSLARRMYLKYVPQLFFIDNDKIDFQQTSPGSNGQDL